MIQVIAVIFSLLSVILAINRSVWAWGVGIIGIIAYFLCFINLHLYAQMWIQVILLIQSIIGWINWSNNSDSNGGVVNVGTLSNRNTIIGAILLIFMCFGTYSVVGVDNTNLITFLDIITACLSLIANYLMMQRKIESWYFWIITNIFMIVLFVNIDLLLSAGLYVIFLVLSVIGVLAWRRSIKIA